MSYHLIESASDAIILHLKRTLPNEIAEVRLVANQQKNLGLPTPAPNSYFYGRNMKALQAPTVYVIATEVDFKKDRGANHVNATAAFEVALVAEAQTTEDVARICWRYQAALHKALDQRRLTSADQALSITCIVRGAKFTEEYDPSDKPGTASGVWRKGTLLRVDVEMYES